MQRVVLDTCVLYPTVLRALLLDSAERGLFTPIWSDRILEEWRRAALKHGFNDAPQIAALATRFPDACVTLSTAEWPVLPDAEDGHILQAAIEGQADHLVTANIKDFPTRICARYGVTRLHPDPFLTGLAEGDAQWMAGCIDQISRKAIKAGAGGVSPRKLLAKAGLPRLGKWFEAQIASGARG